MKKTIYAIFIFQLLALVLCDIVFRIVVPLSILIWFIPTILLFFLVSIHIACVGLPNSPWDHSIDNYAKLDRVKIPLSEMFRGPSRWFIQLPKDYESDPAEWVQAKREYLQFRFALALAFAGALIRGFIGLFQVK